MNSANNSTGYQLSPIELIEDAIVQKAALSFLTLQNSIILSQVQEFA
jgi:hypothetical protein